MKRLLVFVLGVLIVIGNAALPEEKSLFANCRYGTVVHQLSTNGTYECICDGFILP